MANTEVVLGEVIEGQDPVVSIAQSLLPYNWDSNKARYLAYRSCGFTNREAQRLVGITAPSVAEWRRFDPEFSRIEDNLHEIRDKLSEKFIHLEFIRNFILVLRKDYTVVDKSLHQPELMSKFDQDYLMKMRPQYSPQQLEVLKVLTSEEGRREFNFSKFVAEMAKNADTVRLEVERK